MGDKGKYTHVYLENHYKGTKITGKVMSVKIYDSEMDFNSNKVFELQEWTTFGKNGLLFNVDIKCS